MAVSGLANLAVPLLPTTQFALLKYIWMVNGLALSVLWPSLIRLLSESLEETELAKANVVMGTTVCTGTFLTYGGSALFVGMGSFQAVFYTAAFLSLGVGVIWLFAFPRLTAGARFFKVSKSSVLLGKTNVKNRFPKEIWLFLGAIALLAVCNNVIKDGLITWMPAILQETYSLPDWSTLILTMILPLLGAFAAVVAVGIYKKIPSFFIELSILYGISGVLIGIVLGLLSTKMLAVTVVCFGIVAMLMSAVNGVITSMIPLYMREKLGDSGMIAGVLNGFCYVGSTISSYGLGSIAESSGWASVFVLFILLCVFAVLLGGVGAIAQRGKKDE
jgi:OPA family glycerol-3-phosphate transporter-like MFS transporter